VCTGDPLTPVEGREVLYEGDTVAGKFVAPAAETQGIAGVSPFIMPDLSLFGQDSSSDQGEDLAGDDAEGEVLYGLSSLSLLAKQRSHV
jgi:hypothetical protein